MKVTYNWLKDFVDIKLSAKALAEKLTMAGLEVTSLEERDGDFIFEIEVTSNRPDWLSVIGIAREVAAITGKKLHNLPRIAYRVSRKNAIRNTHGARLSAISIEDKKDCPLYTVRIIRGIKAGPSPDWLRRRLELVGCRSVNHIVDITNYILFEYGEPLHAFDLDKLRGDRISVRRGKTSEKIITIDGQERVFNRDVLVIADTENPVAIAGIMGGKDTEVGENTKNILLEAAIFNPVTVRRARQGLGLASESAYRFERGIDPQMVDKASMRAAELIRELAAGEFILAKSVGSFLAKKKVVGLGHKRLQNVLGADIPYIKVKKMLEGLGFKVRPKAKNNFSVEVPSHRQDVNLEADLIEEVARIYGYENIPKSLPAVRPELSTSQARERVSLMKTLLFGLGLNEVITYSLIDKGLLNNLGMDSGAQAIEILNPLSSEQEILRPRLIPGLARCVAHNLNQKQDCVNIFEIANVFSGSAAAPIEQLILGIAVSGARSLLLEQGLVKDESGLLHLKGITETLFERLGAKNYNFIPEADNHSVSIYLDKEKAGFMIKLSKEALDKIEIKNKDVFALELDLEKVLAHIDPSKRVRPLPKYPAITRDISLIIKEEVLAKDVLGAIREKAGLLLREAKIADYYKGKQIPAGYKGLTISCLFRSDERTLIEAEVNSAHVLICEVLSLRFGAKIR